MSTDQHVDRALVPSTMLSCQASGILNHHQRYGVVCSSSALDITPKVHQGTSVITRMIAMLTFQEFQKGRPTKKCKANLKLEWEKVEGKYA